MLTWVVWMLISSCNQLSVMTIPCFFGSSSLTLNLFLWASSMISVMYYLRRVHNTPKKKSLSGSLLDNCSFVGRYLLRTGSSIASSYKFFTEISWYAGIWSLITSFYFRWSFFSERMSLMNPIFVPFIDGRYTFTVNTISKSWIDYLVTSCSDRDLL